MVAQLRARIVGISWRDLAITLGPILLLSLAGIWFAVRFVRPAPPKSVTITAGPDGSMFRIAADKYQTILARNGITLNILPSDGSVENLKRLNDRSLQVDIGFVQGGVVADMQAERRLSQFSGKRLAIGMEGSGARALASTLLKANGIESGGKTAFLNLGGEDAAQALTEHKIMPRS